MKKSNLLALVAVMALVAITFVGCTDNVRAKAWGGNMTVTLPAGQKLVNATWKDAQLWYLTRDMKAGETPESYTFKEKSVWGQWEGSVTFVETK